MGWQSMNRSFSSFVSTPFEWFEDVTDVGFQTKALRSLPEDWQPPKQQLRPDEEEADEWNKSQLEPAEQ